MSVKEKMTAIADAIRGKTEETGKLGLDDMAREIQGLSPFIVPEVTGEAIAVTDSSNRKFRGLTLYGKTTQAGTPTPDAPVALVSAGDGGSINVNVCGKNLLNVDFATTTLRGVTFTNIGEGGVTVSGTTENYPFYSVGQVFLYANTWYYITMNGTVSEKSGFRVVNRNTDPAIVEVTKEIPFTVDYTGWHEVEITANPGFSGTTTVYPMIEVGTTATSYEPFKTLQNLPVSTTNGLAGIPVTSGGNYTDENGQQWICDEMDFARGVYVQRVYQIKLNGNDEITNGSITANTGYYAPYRVEDWTDTYIRLLYATPYKPKDFGMNMCSFLAEGAASSGGYYPNVYLVHPNTNGGNGNLMMALEIEGVTDMATFMEWLSNNPQEVFYALATPIETPLSDEELAAYAALHTNYPNTTIYNDAGAGMKVQYIADTENFVKNHADTIAVSTLDAAYREGVNSVWT